MLRTQHSSGRQHAAGISHQEQPNPAVKRDKNKLLRACCVKRVPDDPQYQHLTFLYRDRHSLAYQLFCCASDQRYQTTTSRLILKYLTSPTAHDNSLEHCRDVLGHFNTSLTTAGRSWRLPSVTTSVFGHCEMFTDISTLFYCQWSNQNRPLYQTSMASANASDALEAVVGWAVRGPVSTEANPNSASTLVRWAVKAFELPLAAVTKNSSNIKLRPDELPNTITATPSKHLPKPHNGQERLRSNDRRSGQRCGSGRCTGCYKRSRSQAQVGYRRRRGRHQAEESKGRS